ncbi:Membrane protein involved in the export of O-antigen and teichoic acid [Paenibacillaceae bacterium GAS479]|nr:Membrane protein involved in the export of O-antigen and teichoic acid [Paenibacillaceae bacterium GAS479]
MALNETAVRMKKKLIVNSSWLFSDKLIRMALGLVVSILMARLLGPENFGKWNYAESFFGMFLIFTTMGLDSIVVRDLVNNKSNHNELLGSAIVLKVLGTIFSIFCSSLFILLLKPDDSLVIMITTILSLASLFQVFDVIDYWFRAGMMSKYTVISKNMAFVISSLLKITLLLLEVPMVYIAVCANIEFLLGSALLILFYYKQNGAVLKWKVSWVRVKELLSDCWPIIISSLAISIQSRIDQVMIGEMLGDEAVGQYSVALRLIEVLGFIPVVIATAFSPVVTRAKLKSNSDYHSTLRMVYRLMFIVFLITAIPVFFFANLIVVILYGEEFSPAGTLLSLFSIRLFFTNFGVAKNLYITNENLFRYRVITSIIGVISNIALNYVLIPVMGVKGSLVASIISFSISIFVIDIFFKRAVGNLKNMVISISTFWEINKTK